MEVLEVGGGLGAEVVGELGAELLVGGDGGGAVAGGVECADEQFAVRFAVGVGGELLA